VRVLGTLRAWVDASVVRGNTGNELIP